MISKYKVGDYEWVDLDFPTEEEIDKIAREYDINSFMARDMASPTPRPRVHTSEKYLYAVMHIPVFKHSHTGENSSQEIDFVIGEKVLITARYDSIDALHQYAKNIEVKGILEKNLNHIRHPFFGLIRELQRFIFNELAWSDDWLSDIEKKIFAGFEKEMVMALSKAGRNILNFKKTARPHQETLDWIADEGSGRWGESFADEMRIVQDNCVHIMDTISGQNEFIIELRETNNSLLSTKQNETMKTLAIISFIMFPLTLIAAIFQMNTTYLPLVGDKHDFWYVLALMAFVTICMFGFFRHKKWL